VAPPHKYKRKMMLTLVKSEEEKKEKKSSRKTFEFVVTPESDTSSLFWMFRESVVVIQARKRN